MQIRQIAGSRTGKIMGKLQQWFGVKMMCRVKFVGGILLHPIAKIKEIKKINKLINMAYRASIKNMDTWKAISRKLIWTTNDVSIYDMLEIFWQTELKLIKNCDIQTDGPIVVCAVKDDLTRIREFMKHYRKLGVEKFIMIDNGSCDGTEEFLAEQDDVLLYKTEEKYNSRKKTAWVNLAIAINGIEQWYLIVDSDEFFAYPEMEKISITDYAKDLKDKGMLQVKTFMLDMYPEGRLCDESKDSEHFIEDYCYFDKDSDFYWYVQESGIAGGGLHARLFGLDKDPRTKISMIYYGKKRLVVGSHHMFPLEEDIETPIGGVVKHYKFLPNDGSKIDKIVSDGNYANGSRMYKKYQNVLKNDGGVSAFYDGSVKWDDKDAFDSLGFVQDLFRMKE